MTWNTNKEVGSSWNEPKSVKNSIIKIEPVKYSWQVQAVAAEVVDPLTSVDIVKPATSVDIVEPSYAPIATTICSDSSQCASGWVCSNGICVQNVGTPASGSYNPTQTSPSFQEQNPGYQPPNGTPGVPNSGANSNVPIGARYPRGTGSGGGGGGFSGCGNDVIIDPGSGKTIAKSKCGPDPADNGCRKSGCGQDERAWDCCGESRCCRYWAGGVACNCGECPEKENGCNAFCSNYLSATGGVMPGCEDAAVCDECEDCIGIDGGTLGTRCAAKAVGQAPCQCEGSKCSGTCETCSTDGTCFQDCDRCVAPFPSFARCSCGYFETTSYVSVCGERWADAVDCSELCPDDPCLGDCKTVWKCNENFPVCPPKTVCDDIGYQTIGSNTCGFRTECDRSNLPPECEECDCNCENDCGDCEICNSSGKCEPDPACEEGYVCQAYATIITETYSCNGSDCNSGLAVAPGRISVDYIRCQKASEFQSEGNWYSAGQNREFLFSSCAKNCGFPNDGEVQSGTYVDQTLMKIPNGPPNRTWPNPIATSGGLGFNRATQIYYNFFFVFGSGNTREEARQNAAENALAGGS